MLAKYLGFVGIGEIELWCGQFKLLYLINLLSIQLGLACLIKRDKFEFNY
jgi:hypothetical protein